jgi:hypothetical protein
MSRRDGQWDEWIDEEREPTRVRRPRKQLTPYGTLRVLFEAPVATQAALEQLRKAGLL